MRKRIELDLGEVTLLDRHCVAFLAEQSRDDVRLINCPVYIEPWIAGKPAARRSPSVAARAGERAGA